MILPLAIYTAGHGLAWCGATQEIPYSELDSCRHLLGALPDFEAGECGYEGVAVVGERVFAIRCFSVSKWDFRGRDSLYLAVTWLPRGCVSSVNFDALLATPELSNPLHNPPKTFRWQSPSCLLDAFGEIRQLASESSPDVRIRFVRPLAAGGIVRQLEDAVDISKDEGFVLASNKVGEAKESLRLGVASCVATIRDWGKQNAAYIVGGLAAVMTIGLLVAVAIDFLKMKHSTSNSNEIQVVKQEETKNDRSRKMVEESGNRETGGEHHIDAADASRTILGQD